MTTCSQAEFARRIGGVDRSAVTRWKQAGRIVMAGDLVDIEASEARLAETADPNRDDVANRHAAARALKATPGATEQPVSPNTNPPRTPAAAGTSAPEMPEEDKSGMSYQAARAVKEKYAALKARADYEQQIGDLIARDDVDAAMKFVGATVRSEMEILPDQLAPLVVPITSIEEAHTLIAEAGRNILVRLGEAIERQQAALARHT